MTGRQRAKEELLLIHLKQEILFHFSSIHNIEIATSLIICSVPSWWKVPIMEYAFGKSLFGRKLHYAGRLMFGKSRQGAHIAFNISNIENWKSRANGCPGNLENFKETLKERDKQKNVLGFQKWIIDSTGSFFWQRKQIVEEKTLSWFLLLFATIQKVLVDRRKKCEKETEIRTHPFALTFQAFWQNILKFLIQERDA